MRPSNVAEKYQFSATGKRFPQMVSQCANSSCGKPLLYLRDGRIFLFKMKKDVGDRRVSQAEHFWLCGDCAQSFVLEPDGSSVHLVPKEKRRRPVTVIVDSRMGEEIGAEDFIAPTALAS